MTHSEKDCYFAKKAQIPKKRVTSYPEEIPLGGNSSRNKNNLGPVTLNSKSHRKLVSAVNDSALFGNQNLSIKNQSSLCNSDVRVYKTKYWYRTDLDVKNTESLFAKGNKRKYLGCPRNGSVAKQTVKSTVVRTINGQDVRRNITAVQAKSKVSVNLHRPTEVDNTKTSLVSCVNNESVNINSHVSSTHQGEFSHQPATNNQTDESVVGDKNEYSHGVGRMQVNDMYNGQVAETIVSNKPDNSPTMVGDNKTWNQEQNSTMKRVCVKKCYYMMYIMICTRTSS